MVGLDEGTSGMDMFAEGDGCVERVPLSDTLG